MVLRKQFVMARVRKDAIYVAGIFTCNTISILLHKSASRGIFGSWKDEEVGPGNIRLSFSEEVMHSTQQNDPGWHLCAPKDPRRAALSVGCTARTCGESHIRGGTS